MSNEKEPLKADALATKELGPAIVQAAIDRRRKQLESAVVGTVEEMLRLQTVANIAIRDASKILAETQEKIDKLNAGEFTISDTGIITYL